MASRGPIGGQNQNSNAPRGQYLDTPPLREIPFSVKISLLLILSLPLSMARNQLLYMTISCCAEKMRGGNRGRGSYHPRSCRLYLAAEKRDRGNRKQAVKDL